jgi:hypothetical protein
MGVKFVIGLTDVTEHESFYPTPDVVSTYQGPADQFEKVAYYVLQNNNTSIEKASIEWILDTSLPAVNSVLDIIDTVKQSLLNVTHIYAHKYTQEVLPSLFDTDFIVEMKNLVPVDGLVFPEYTDVDYDNVSTNRPAVYCSLELDGIAAMLTSQITDVQTLSYAMSNSDLSYLPNGPIVKYVYPTFRINLRHSNETVLNKSMSIEQRQWMNDNNSVLASKGYSELDSKNKLGSLVIGQLVGSYQEAFSKSQQYTRICRVEIVRD